MTDSDLINACLRNDRSAQRILYDRYKRAMYTLAYRLTSDFDDANDVLQDTFLDVFRKLETFKGESTIGAWSGRHIRDFKNPSCGNCQMKFLIVVR